MCLKMCVEIVVSLKHCVLPCMQLQYNLQGYIQFIIGFGPGKSIIDCMSNSIHREIRLIICWLSWILRPFLSVTQKCWILTHLPLTNFSRLILSEILTWVLKPYTTPFTRFQFLTSLDVKIGVGGFPVTLSAFLRLWWLFVKKSLIFIGV